MTRKRKYNRESNNPAAGCGLQSIGITNEANNDGVPRLLHTTRGVCGALAALRHRQHDRATILVRRVLVDLDRIEQAVLSDGARAFLRLMAERAEQLITSGARVRTVAETLRSLHAALCAAEDQNLVREEVA